MPRLLGCILHSIAAFKGHLSMSVLVSKETRLFHGIYLAID